MRRQAKLLFFYYSSDYIGMCYYLLVYVNNLAKSISDIYIVILSAIHFSLLCHHNNISFKSALSNSPGAAVSFLLGILAIIPVLFLLHYHIRVSLLAMMADFSTNVTAEKLFKSYCCSILLLLNR